MSKETLRVYAESTIQAAMHTTYPAVPIKFENASFVQPDTVWTVFHIVDGGSFVRNLGTIKVDRHIGLVQFDVLVPQNTGTKTANLIAEFGGMQFREKKVTLSDGAVVSFQAPYFKSLGTSGGFYRLVCSVNYWRDEFPQ